MELYEKNGGCQLPCWWGFEPGKTRWDTARKLLEKFDSSIYYPDPRLESVSYDVYIPTESEFWYPAPRRQIYIVENGIINRIEVKVVNLFPYSDLITMFQRYGEPEEIWVSALAGDNPESAVLLYLIVFYREKGIMTWYADGYLAKIDGDTLVGCPHLPDRGLSMQLWNPLERYSFAEMLEKSVDFPREEPHLRLEEATGISEHGYYDMLVNSSSPQCLKSPVELWLRFPQ